MESGKKRGASGSRKRPAKALSDSDEELSSDDDMEFEPEPYSGSRAGKTAAEGRMQQDESDDEPVVFTDADLIEDEEDAKRLAAMTELEREFELAERSERKQQELQRNKLLRKAQREAEAAAAPAGPRTSVATTRSKKEALEGDQGGRAMRSGREEREEAAKKSAMQELVAARRARIEGTSRVEDKAKSQRESKTTSSLSSEEVEEELSEEDEGALFEEEEKDIGEEWGRPGSWKTRFGGPAKREEDDEEEAGFEEVSSIVLPRHKLEKWFNEPFFSRTMPGCMVRVSLGPRLCPDGIERPRYVLAQIVDVEERAAGIYKDSGQPWKSPYPFGPAQERTDYWLRVSRGYSERGMPMALVSNGPVTREEWEGWQATCQKEQRPPPSRGEVAEVRDRIRAAETYTYSAADVAAVLERKRASRRGAVGNVALEKARLERLRDAALESGDTLQATEYEKQLAALEVATQEALNRRGAGPSMEEINRKNKTINFQNAINNVSNKVASGAKSGTGSVLDPFSRRATRPQNYWSTKAESQNEKQTEEDQQFATEEALSIDASQETTVQHQPILDLSSLDLSLLDRPSELPLVARRILGDSVARQLQSANRRAAAALANGRA